MNQPHSEPTRAEAQARANAAYALGSITLREYRDRTAELSDVTKWTAKGRTPQKLDSHA